jgi:cytochrome P450
MPPHLFLAEQKLEKSGVLVPKGVEVLIPICLLNRDVDEWGEPILKYDPDRFSEDGPEGTHRKQRRRESISRLHPCRW